MLIEITKMKLFAQLLNLSAYQKCQENHTLEIYPYLEVEKQFCHPHYYNIVEPNRGQNNENK